MKKFLDDESEFSVLGMTFKTKYTLFVVAIFCGVILLLAGLDLLSETINISWYGLLIGVGFLLAVVFASKLAKYRDLDKDMPYDLIWWVFPFSIVGARAYFVIFEGVPLFWDAFKVWEGGLAIYGGIIGGVIGGVIFCLIKKQSIMKSADLVAPVLILGQAIGRWGNFINQEVYGFEIVDKAWQWFPFGVFIESTGTWHLATFFYESMLNLIGFFVLIYLLRKVRLTGIVAFSYLFFYGIVRYFLEGLRISKYILYIPSTNFPVSQAVSIFMVIAGVIGIAVILLRNMPSRSEHEKVDKT